MADEKHDKPKIISDEDWKSQAKKEKEQFTDQDKAKKQSAEPPEFGSSESPDKSGSPPKRARLPQADFTTLMNSLAMQALFALGRLAGPGGEQQKPDTDLAKYHIDTLQILADKTEGNLDDQEKKALVSTLHELRMQYIQATE